MRKIALVAALALAGLSVSACRDGRPGHSSDRQDRHDGDRDHDRDRDHDNYR